MSSEIKPIIASIDTAPWEDHTDENGNLLFSTQRLSNDTDLGGYVEHLRIQPGSVTKPHYHHCAHGVYVLKGTLKTHTGTYGPGTMVWFPEGCIMEHGATEDEEVEILQIVNKPFDINFI